MKGIQLSVNSCVAMVGKTNWDTVHQRYEKTARSLVQVPLVCACLLVTMLLLGGAEAAVPNLISYQGRITVNGGNFDGNGTFRFALVNSDGSTSYWSNDGTSAAGSEPTAGVTLAVSNGLYSVLLGDTGLANMTAVPHSVFSNEPIFLRVWFDDGANGSQQLGADHRISAVAYAMVAASVDDAAVATDSEVVSLVLAGDGSGSTLDADLLDGLNSDAFVATSGDMMSGPLDIRIDEATDFLKLRGGATAASKRPVISGIRSKGTNALPTIVADDDVLFSLTAAGYDGNSFPIASSIDFEIDGEPGDEDLPGRIVFKTTPDAGNLRVTRMVIKADGKIGVGTDSPAEALDVNGTIRATALEVTGGAAPSIGTQTRYYSFSSKAFQSNEFVNINSTYIMSTGSGTTGLFYADLHLPHGSTITGVKGVFYDSDECQSVDLRIYEQTTGGGGQIAHLSTGHVATNATEHELSVNSLSAVVDNSTSSYVVQLQFSKVGVNNCGGEIRFYRAMITYTTTDGLP